MVPSDNQGRMSLALEQRRRSRSDPREGSPSLGWANRDRAPSPRNNAPNSPSILGGAEEINEPGPHGTESESDEFEDVPPSIAVDPMDVPNLPSEASPSLRSVPASAAAPPPLLLSTAIPPAPMPSDNKRVVSFEELYARQLPSDVYEAPPVPAGTRVVQVKDRVVQFKRAPCKRASRAARPNEPSQISRRVCQQLIHTREQELKRNGRTKLTPDDVFKYRANSASGGRGPAVRAQVEHEQARMNHLAALKARNVETYNTEASFLLWGNTSEQCYDKLAESALRANAGGAAITKRKDTQGAAYQSKSIHLRQHALQLLDLLRCERTLPCGLLRVLQQAYVNCQLYDHIHVLRA